MIRTMMYRMEKMMVKVLVGQQYIIIINRKGTGAVASVPFFCYTKKVKKQKYLRYFTE